MSELRGKTVVITGASSGLGRSTAIEFAKKSPKYLKLSLSLWPVELIDWLSNTSENTILIFRLLYK